MLAAETEQLFDAAEFPGPTGRFNIGQIENMLLHSNLIVTAKENEKLIGIALSMANFSSVCFLVALAVHSEYQGREIGKNLINKTRKEGDGKKVSFVTVSTPNAVGFYESNGMEHCKNAFIIPRER